MTRRDEAVVAYFSILGSAIIRLEELRNPSIL
jgi:hypothetical protein